MIKDTVRLVSRILEQPNRVGWYVLDAAGHLLTAYCTFTIVRMERRPLEPREAYEADPVQAMVDSGDRWQPAIKQCHLAWDEFCAGEADVAATQKLAATLLNGAKVLRNESRVSKPPNIEEE